MHDRQPNNSQATGRVGSVQKVWVERQARAKGGYIKVASLFVSCSCWPGLDEYRFRVYSCLNALSLANLFLVSMIYGVYIIVISRSFVTISVWFPWTLGHTCDSLSLSLTRQRANNCPSIVPLTHRLVLLCIDAHCFILWDLPGDVLAAPESALWLDRCNTSLSLSFQTMKGWPAATVHCQERGDKDTAKQARTAR